MPRTKKLQDEDVHRLVLDVMAERGTDGVTFAAVAERSGLSASTLVQRFGTKQAMIRAALLQAWDQLDERTAALGAKVERTPDGAVDLLSGLSGGYGDIERYANNLHVLREDFRDPELRARGARWIAALSRRLDECLAGATQSVDGRGSLMVAQWQGALLLWAFTSNERAEAFVRGHLRRFVAAFGA